MTFIIKHSFFNLNIYIFFISFFISCSSPLTNEGVKDIETLRDKYGCFEITNGEGIQTERNGNEIKFISIRFVKCKNELHFDSIQNYPLLRQKIATDMSSYYNNKSNFQGVMLEFDIDKNTGLGNKQYLYLFEDKNYEKLIFSDSTIVEKF